MPRGDVKRGFQEGMSRGDVERGCQEGMSREDVKWECQERMPRVDVNIGCQQTMSRENITMECKEESICCLKPSPTSNEKRVSKRMIGVQEALHKYNNRLGTEAVIRGFKL